MQYSTTPLFPTAPVTTQSQSMYSFGDYLPSAGFCMQPLEPSHNIFVEPLDHWCASASKNGEGFIQQPPGLEGYSSLGAPLYHLRGYSNDIVPPPGLSPSASCDMLTQSLPATTAAYLAESGTIVEQPRSLEVGSSLSVPWCDLRGYSNDIVPPLGLSPSSTCESETPSSPKSTVASLADIDGDQYEHHFQRLAQSEAPLNVGSRGHPELCTRPCIYFAVGQCANGTGCLFCHGDHEKRTTHLDKRQRLAVKEATFLEVAQTVIPILKSKLEAMGIGTKILSPLDDLLAQGYPIKPLPGQGRLTATLRNMAIRSLLAVLSRKADRLQNDKLDGVLKHLQNVFGLIPLEFTEIKDV